MLIIPDLQVIVPSLLPQVSAGQANPIAVEWTRIALSSPALFHTWLHGAAVHAQAIQGRPLGESRDVQLSYFQAIEALNEAMHDPTKALADENILAVSGLASYAIDVTIDSNRKVPSQGPLKNLRGLDVYSALTTVPEHARGLATLVELKGGLDRIRTPGIASTIS